VARAQAAPLTDDARLLNRELSWLDYNARVLARASDPALPLLERSRNCAYFSSNLDEFFQVRGNPREDTRAHRSAGETLEA